jgi:putative ABC transport system permease protein
MIRHLLALTWNRRRANLLLMIEIFVAFMVLAVMSTLGFWGWRAYHKPLGYSLDDVWKVGFRTERDRAGTEGPDPQRVRQVLTAVAGLPQVAAVAGMDGGAPYEGAKRESRINGREYSYSAATDTLPAVLGIRLERGRWFGREDDGASARPVVVSEGLARAHFGAADPLGRRLDEDVDRTAGASPPAGPARSMRVVGVVRAYRFDPPLRGDYDEPKEFLFQRLRVDGPDPSAPRSLLVKLRPGTPAAFEEILLKAMQAVAREWSFEITRYDQRQDRMVNQALAFFAVLGALAAFLLVMVALGLSGVVWQNVAQRTSEIGLRRAQGATAADIRWQFLGELMGMASLAMVPGAVVIAHFAGVFAHLAYFSIGWVTTDVYLVGFAFSAASIYVLVLLAGFFPTRLATRIQPFEALRYE